MNKETIYDEQIAPLMEQVHALCEEHRIPVAAVFNYAAAEDGLDVGFCISGPIEDPNTYVTGLARAAFCGWKVVEP